MIRHIPKGMLIMKNKIKVDRENIFLKDNISYLKIDEYKEYSIFVNANIKSTLIVIGTSDYKLNIYQEENSNLLVNSLNKDNSVDINIELKKNSSIIYNHSVTANKDSINNFNIKHLESDSKSIINNNGINRRSNKLFFSISGIIPKNLTNINCNQNSKIINFNKGNSKIIPNLIIDSNDIIANHSAYIGEINEEELFYLLTRGIKLENIQKLMYKATLLSKMDNYNEEEFNQIINEWW